MTEKDRLELKGYATMKPPLGTQTDQDALWAGLLDRTIDLVETDHAPHTKEEKEAKPPAFGIPGLETMVGLLFRAVHDKKIPIELVTEVIYSKPRQIFAIPEQENTYVELDPDKPWIVGSQPHETKCGWSTFEGWELFGLPETVVIAGKKVVEAGRIVE